MNFPDNLKYTEDHEWLKIEDGIFIVGITDYAQDQLGDIVYVEIDTVEEDLSQGEEFGSVEAVKTVSELFMPISGKILEKNPQLDDAPDLVNSSPFDEGWMIKIEPSDLTELDGLMDAEAYKALVS